MVEILILYYSRSGRTETLAKALLQGVTHLEGVTPKLKHVTDATIDDLISCDAVAFGSPNYFSYMAGLMKDFFDRSLSVRDKVMGKPAVAFTSGGGASNTALLSLERMITSFRLEKIVKGVISQGTPTQQDLDTCEQIGEALARAALKNNR